MAQDVTSDTETLAEQVFFVVGTGRSGTTLLVSMFSKHPRLHVPPESMLFTEFDPQKILGRSLESPSDVEAFLAKAEQHRFWGDMGIEADVLRERLAGRDTVGDVTYFIEVLRIWREQGDKPRVGEKTPKHERTIERILEIFPKARFIQVIRDPRDVAASIQALGWAEHGTLARSAEMLAQVYDRHFQREASLSAQQYIAVRYEDLIADAEGELRRLSDFLGEPFDEEMLRFNEREDSGFMERERGWKELTLKPLTTARVGRYRDKLTPRQVRTVEHVLGSRLQRLGYAREADMPDKLSWRIADASAVMTWRLWRIVRPLVRTIRPNRPRVTRAESTRATTGS